MTMSTELGSRVFRSDVMFNAIKVFSATMLQDRSMLGDKVTDWIASHPNCTVTEMVVTQSSDAQFHCIALTLFYREPAAARR